MGYFRTVCKKTGENKTKTQQLLSEYVLNLKVSEQEQNIWRWFNKITTMNGDQLAKYTV